MKKLMILAMSVLMVASVSAQEVKAEKAEGKKDKKEFRMSNSVSRWTSSSSPKNFI